MFEFACLDGRLGYGFVVIRSAGGAPYIVIFGSIHSNRPIPSEVSSDRIVLQGWTMDALIYHGRWVVIAHDVPRPRDLRLPNWKVDIRGETYATDVAGEVLGPILPFEKGLLDFQSSRSPIAYQNAFEALHGLRKWDVSYDDLTPEYAAPRATRAGG